MASPTNRRESPHKLSVSVFKERHRCAGLRCLPSHFRARQKRNSKLLRSFRQPPRFFISRCRRRPEPASSHPVFQPASAARGRILLSRFWPSTPSNFLFSRYRRPGDPAPSQPVFSTGTRCEGGASLLSRFWPSTPSNFLFSRCRRPVEISFFAARLSTGARCEGGASYCLVTGRQHRREIFFRVRFDREKHGYFFATRKPSFRGRRVNLQEPERGSKIFFDWQSALEVLPKALGICYGEIAKPRLAPLRCTRSLAYPPGTGGPVQARASS